MRVGIALLALLLWAAGGGDGPANARAPERQQPPQEATTASQPEGRASVAVRRNVKVEVDNRTAGRITIIGWDKEQIEATARSERGAEAARLRKSADGFEEQVTINVARAEWREPEVKEQPGAPDKTPQVVLPGLRSIFNAFDRSDNIDLEVRLPRTAEIDVIRVNRSDVTITGVSTPLVIDGNRSTIKLSQVGAVEVRTGSGPVEVDGASALVDVITTSGSISVANATGDVRALSISGSVMIRCSRGRINVSNTDGPIRFDGISGDVDAVTTTGEIRFAGAVRDGGRYYLKSMSGRVEMAVRPNPPGFTATLSSYRGEIETEFPFKPSRAERNTAVNRRLSGRVGNGRAQITLDSFDGRVKLGRAPQAANECGQ